MSGAGWVAVPGFNGRTFRMRLNVEAAEFREMAQGTYDRDELAALARGARDAVVWDVGAHVGYASLMLASALGVKEVHAFEPHPGNVVRIVRHRKENRADEIQVHLLALSDVDADGMLQFFDEVDAPQSTGGYLQGVQPPLESTCYAGFTSGPCALRSGDSLVAAEEMPLALPHLVKIDVEGSEFKVLHGMKRTLGAAMPRVLLEVHSAALWVECTLFLERLGYRVQTLRVLSQDRAHLLATVP